MPVIWLGGDSIRPRRGWWASPQEPGTTGMRCFHPKNESQVHEVELPDMADRPAVEEWLNG